MVKLLKRENIRVVFSEETFSGADAESLRDEAGVKVYIITHIAVGRKNRDKFEREMQRMSRRWFAPCYCGMTKKPRLACSRSKRSSSGGILKPCSTASAWRVQRGAITLSSDERRRQEHACFPPSSA